MQTRSWLKAALAAGLAALTSSSLAIGAYAALGDAIPPATGDLVIHKFIGAPVSNQERTGEKLDTTAWTGVTPASGVVFDLYQVGAPVNPDPPADPWTDVPSPGRFVRNADTGNLEVYSGTSLIGVYGLTAASPASVTTGANGEATAAGLPQGLYLVVENAAASTSITNASTGEPLFISQTAAPFVVAVPMTAPDGTGWLSPVHVYPKNEALTIDKVVDAAGSSAVGDTVSYTITVSVPGDIATAQTFAVLDKLDAALDLDLATVTVATLPELTGSSALVKNTDYNITYDPTSRTVTIAFTPSGFVKLGGAGSVVVTLDTTINSSILSAPGRAVPNTATVDFTNEGGTKFHADSGGGEESQVYTATVTVTKVDQAGKALNGASFAIASSQANAAAGKFLRLDPTSKVVYDVDAPEWATLGEAADYVISPANQASFTGLRDAIEANGVTAWQTYWVVETVAPATYNLLSAPVEASFEAASTAAGADYDHVLTLTVKNSQGFTLPETGGVGTVGLTVGGVVLLGTALLLVVTRRRRMEDQGC